MLTTLAMQGRREMSLWWIYLVHLCKWIRGSLVHMKMQGQIAELLVKLDPKLYRKYIQIENEKRVLYVQLKKALYGMLKAALLFWKKLTAEIEK
jgi:hypothetical protein